MFDYPVLRRLCSVLSCLQDPDTYVRRNAAVAIREVVKHSEELAAIVSKAGGAAALVQYANGCAGAARLAAVMALGMCVFISAFACLAVHVHVVICERMWVFLIVKWHVRVLACANACVCVCMRQVSLVRTQRRCPVRCCLLEAAHA